MRQRQLDRLPDLLLLHVQPAHVRIRHVGLLVLAQHRDAAVGFRGQDVDQSVGVAVQGDGGGGLEQLAIQRG